MSSRTPRFLIEFTEDTHDAVGTVIRSKGDRLLVDPMSARSFVDKKKVAKIVTEDQPSAEVVTVDDSGGLDDDDDADQPQSPVFGAG